MKILKFTHLIILAISIASVTGCKKDSEEVSQFVGNYVISNAKLAAALSVTTTQTGAMQIPANTDITQAIRSALLSAVSCSSSDKSYVEMRKDYTLFLSCELANPLNAGTWAELTATSLQLNLNSTAIPPTGFVLTVTNLVLNASVLSGTATVPLRKEMVAGMIAPLTLAASSPDFFMVSITIEFMKK